MKSNQGPTRNTDSRSLAEKHKDIEFSNAYRIEYIKHLMAIAAGVFAFTITFAKDFLGRAASGTAAKPLLLLGWGALLVSLVAGVMHMRFWASYYVYWANALHDLTAKEWRARLDITRKITELVQVITFMVGMGCLFLFAAVNMYS